MSLKSVSSKPLPALPLAVDLAAFLPVALGAWATTAGFLAGDFAGGALAVGLATTFEVVLAAGLATDFAAGLAEVLATGLAGDLATGLAGALATGLAAVLATGFATGLAAAFGATLWAAFLTARVGAGFLDLDAVGMKTPEFQMKDIFCAENCASMNWKGRNPRN
jgi:hypothetical protein